MDYIRGSLALALALIGCTRNGAPASDAGLHDAPPADASLCRRRFHEACLEVVVPRSEIPIELATDDAYLYYSIGTSPTIRRVSKATREIEPFVVLDRSPARILVAGDHLYYSTIPTSGTANASVGRVFLPDASITPLVTNLSSAALLAVDGGYLYFTKSGGDIARVPIGGGEEEPLTNASFPLWIAARDGEMYWIERVWNAGTSQWSGVLSHATPDFSFAENLETEAVTMPASLAASHVYWYDHFGGGIYRTPRVKGTTELLASVDADSVTRAAYALGISGDYVYFVASSHPLARLPRDGGAVENILTADFYGELVVEDDGAYLAIPYEGIYFVPDAL